MMVQSNGHSIRKQKLISRKPETACNNIATRIEETFGATLWHNHSGMNNSRVSVVYTKTPLSILLERDSVHMELEHFKNNSDSDLLLSSLFVSPSHNIFTITVNKVVEFP